MTDLRTLQRPADSGWYLATATGINDKGQIIGTGVFNGVFRGYIATPVPEPATVAALAFGALGLVARRRKKA